MRTGRKVDVLLHIARTICEATKKLMTMLALIRMSNGTREIRRIHEARTRAKGSRVKRISITTSAKTTASNHVVRMPARSNVVKDAFKNAFSQLGRIIRSYTGGTLARSIRSSAARCTTVGWIEARYSKRIRATLVTAANAASIQPCCWSG